MLGATLLLADTALLVLSRLVLIDSLLLLFILLSLTTLLASLRRDDARGWGLMVVSAICAGLAVSTKWTGLSAIGVALLVVIWRRVTRVSPWRETAKRLAICVAIPAVIYVGAFGVHFALLPRWGLDASIMSPAFQETLVQSPTHVPGAALSFATRFADVHRAMIETNTDIESRTHPGASPWWSWPILKHPMYVWQGQPSESGARGHILIVGNPVVWLGTLVVLATLVMVAAVSGHARARLASRRRAVTLLLLCYVINFVPFALIERHLFIYSYLPAFTFSVALAIVAAGTLAGAMAQEEPGSDAQGSRPVAPQAPRRAITAIAGFVLLALTVSVYLAPLAYGTPITNAGFANRLRLVERAR